MSERSLGNAAHAWVRRWWRGEGGAVGSVLDHALSPVEHLFGAIVAARNGAYERGLLRIEHAEIPVISIGNLSVGGAGKTPVAAWLSGRLLAWGFRPAIVLRGYAEDEVDVHRELNPEVEVVIGKRRVAAVAEAAGRGCDVAVVDDGFQHRALARDLDVVLVSADGWTERRPLLPRGPWRERVTGLRRAGVAMVTRKAASLSCAEAVGAALERAVPGITVVICQIEPSRLVPLHGGTPLPIDELSGREILAVASLADPEPFLRNLQAARARVELLTYPDHHDFDRSDADRILRERRGRPLLMTRKDAVKLRTLIPTGSEALVLEQRVRMERGGDLLDEALRKAVRR